MSSAMLEDDRKNDKFPPRFYHVHAGPAKWRENNGAVMTSCSRKKFPVWISETEEMKITPPPRFSILTAADLSQKTILSSFSIFL